jgi:glycerate dehydrogenase
MNGEITLKIVFLDEQTISLNGDIDLRGVKALGDYDGFALLPSDNPLPYCTHADVVITNKVKMGRTALEQLPHISLICVAATGYDNIDVEAASELGIHVANVSGYATKTVVQHVFAMVLMFANRILSYQRDVQRGEWQRSEMFGLLRYATFELAGKVFGVIGCGAIGMEAARVAEVFGMKVLMHDIADIRDTGYENHDIDEVLEASDVISLHCPLNEQSRNLINRETMSRMKSTAILINTARGGIVNEQDLANALNEGKLAGAGVDTLSVEPPVDDNPLLGNVKNLIVTPHSAWSARDARQRLMDTIADRIQSFKKGEHSGLIV